MIWGDVLLGSAVAEQRLRTAFARTFAVNADDVLIIDDMDDMHLPYGVAVTRIPHTGPQFPLQLTITTPELAVASVYPRAGTLERLAAALDERVLAPSDDTPNPYIFTLYLPTGEVQEVVVDSVAMDEREEYLIDGPVDPETFDL
jgi:hypothetical protein